MPLPDVRPTAWSCLALVLHTAVRLKKPYSPHDLGASLLLTVSHCACCATESGRQWTAVLMVILSKHRQRNTVFKHSIVAKAKLCSKALVLKTPLVSMYACLPFPLALENTPACPGTNLCLLLLPIQLVTLVPSLCSILAWLVSCCMH